jgi:hypothetical protein
MTAASSIEVLRLRFGVVHRQLDTHTAVSPQSLARNVFIEDVTVNTILAGGAPLALSTWRGRTGLSRLPPLRWSPGDRAWANKVSVDMAELRPYAQAVYAATDHYLCVPVADRLTVCVLTALLLSLSARRREYMTVVRCSPIET